MTLDEFVAQWNGRYANFSYGGQCVDLVEFWYQNLGLPRFWGNAVDQAGRGNWVANGPSNAPSPGDVVVWGLAVGPFGHIDIAVSGDANSFTGFDQNWPDRSPCHLQGHNYRGVLGWQAMGVAAPPAPPPPPSPPPPAPPPTPPVPVAAPSDVPPLLLLALAGAAAGVTYWRHRRAGEPVTLRTVRQDLALGLRTGEEELRRGGRLAGRGLEALGREALELRRRP